MAAYTLRIFVPSDIGCTEDRLQWYFEGAIRGWHQGFATENDPIRGMSKACVVALKPKPDDSASRIAGLEARLAESEAALTDCRSKGDNTLRDAAMLEAGFTAATANADHARERLEVERAENAALKAEVERLREAANASLRLGEIYTNAVRIEGGPARIRMSDGSLVTGEIAELVEALGKAMAVNAAVARSALQAIKEAGNG